MTRPLHAVGSRVRRHVCTCDRGALSAVQVRIVALVADGWANDRIAAAVHLAPGTVPAYLTRARHRIGAASREHLVALALRDRLIGFDPDGRVVVLDEHGQVAA